MRSSSKFFDELREFIGSVPIVDCHDHTLRVGPKLLDPIHALVGGYYASDLWSVSSDTEIAAVLDTSVPWRERWPLFKKYWELSKHTGYGQVLQRLCREFYQVDELTLETMQQIEKNILKLEDADVFDSILEKANIVVRISDVLISDVFNDERGKKEFPLKVLDKTMELMPRGRIVISLPDYHNVCSYEDIALKMASVKRSWTTLDDYLAGCFEIFKGYKEYGAVAFKDQSAYRRSISYSNPSKAEAEEVFNWIVSDPRRRAGYPDQVKPLDDYLFHRFLDMAAELELPVQIHTGLLAGIRHNVSGANAINLVPVLELHRNVNFDLFHGNWPYSGEWLFLGKNYPNVYLNFCWTNIIDPIYSQEVMKQAISSVPHGKVFAYGSDYVGLADHAWAHAEIMKDNLAIALSSLVDIEYLSLKDAKQIAKAWLYENPNRFFKLGLPAI